MLQILVTGAAGQLGREFSRIAQSNESGFSFVFSDLCDGYNYMDVTDTVGVKNVINKHGVDVIINCAAYTAVDKAERMRNEADAVNAKAVGVLAAVAKDMGITMIHFSTDYVFAGDSDRPYLETDATLPINYYGESKRKGEVLFADSGCKGIIIRTSWLYCAYGSNFVKTVIRMGREKNRINMISDQWGCPTYAADLAEAVIKIIPSLISQPHYADIYHYCNAGKTSWYGFAQAVIKDAGLECEVMPITTGEYPTQAKRPSYSVLDTQKITRDFGCVPPGWETSLRRCVKEILENEK